MVPTRAHTPADLPNNSLGFVHAPPFPVQDRPGRGLAGWANQRSTWANQVSESSAPFRLDHQSTGQLPIAADSNRSYPQKGAVHVHSDRGREYAAASTATTARRASSEHNRGEDDDKRQGVVLPLRKPRELHGGLRQRRQLRHGELYASTTSSVTFGTTNLPQVVSSGRRADNRCQ